VRVVGYVREAPGPESGDSVFAQTERIRRWVQHHGYQLVAMCQDSRSADPDREGYRALLGILAAAQADLVALARLDALSTDKIDQEIMLADLRRRGAAVAVTEDNEVDAIADPPGDAARRLVRDVLQKRDAYQRLVAETEEAPELTIELIPHGPRPPSGTAEAS